MNHVRSFYATYDLTVKFKGKSKLPNGQVKNKRLKLRTEEIKKLLEWAPTKRDRAIILCGYQAGMDVSTLCSIRYGQVRLGLERNECPLMLELNRVKSEVESSQLQ